MAENKKSFVLYSDSKSIIDLLTNEQAGLLLKTLFAYVNDENPKIDNSIALVFEMIKLQLKRDLKKWERTKEGRSVAGKASAEAKRLIKLKEQNSTNSTNVDFVQQTSTKSTVSVSVNDSVSVSVNDSVKENIINNTLFVFECKKSTQWIEVTAMQNKVSPEIVNLYLDNFENHLIQMEEQKKTAKEYKEHFTHWFKKQDLSNFRVKSLGKTNQI